MNFWRVLIQRSDCTKQEAALLFWLAGWLDSKTCYWINCGIVLSFVLCYVWLRRRNESTLDTNQVRLYNHWAHESENFKKDYVSLINRIIVTINWTYCFRWITIYFAILISHNTQNFFLSYVKFKWSQICLFYNLRTIRKKEIKTLYTLFLSLCNFVVSY